MRRIANAEASVAGARVATAVSANTDIVICGDGMFASHTYIVTLYLISFLYGDVPNKFVTKQQRIILFFVC